MFSQQKDKFAKFAEAINFCKTIKNQRYRMGIICLGHDIVLNRFGKSLADELNAQYLDVHAELLPFIGRSKEYPVLGAYDENDFINQIFKKSCQMQNDFLIVDQAESLLVTFGKQGVIKFFNSIGFIEPKYPIILVTYLEKQLHQSDISKKNVIYL